jgi:hypothetical protein
MRSDPMLAGLGSVGRVRDVRSRLAMNEALRLRHAYARMQSIFDEVQRNKLEHELRAAQVGTWMAQASAETDTPSVVAADAHQVMSYVDAARLKAREAAATARRTELARQRALVAADEAGTVWRRALVRHDAIVAARKRAEQADRRRRLEREDERLAEEHAIYEASRCAGPWMEPSDECPAGD